MTEDVAETIAADVEVVTTGPATAGRPALEPADGTELADLVVLLALGFVAEHVVRRADFLEPFLGSVVAGVRVGMAGARQLSVGLGDVFGRGIFTDAQDLVVVLLVPLTLCGHVGNL